MPLRQLSPEEIEGLGIRPNTTQPLPTRSITEKLGGALDAFFGGGTIGEAIGTGLAKSGLTGLSPEQRQNVSDAPSGKQIAGDVLRSGALFTPAGRIAGGAAKAAPFLGKAAPVAGASLAGGVAGAGFDVGEALRKEEPLTPIATGVGVGLPPALKTTGFAVRKFGMLARELSGVTTGSGSAVVQEMFDASRAGGARAQQALRALRGRVDEDVLVSDAKLALNKVVERRNAEFAKNFPKVINNKQTLDISPIIKTMNSGLKNLGVKTTDEGLDFSQSRFRFNKQAQNEITEIVEELKVFGTQAGDRTPLGLDTLKRGLRDFHSESKSKELLSFTDGVRQSTRGVLSKVKGYDKVEADYAATTGMIEEMSRALSLGDKAARDTTFRKLTSALRINNELRAQVLKQLDEEAGQFLTAQIAGQQLSEVLPRGILRSFGIGAGLVSALTGAGIMPFLQIMVMTSPRLVGEFVRVLGLTARQADEFVKALQTIAPKSARTPGDVILDKVTPQ